MRICHGSTTTHTSADKLQKTQGAMVPLRCSFMDNILHAGKGKKKYAFRRRYYKIVDAGRKSAKPWYQHCCSKCNSTLHKAINCQTYQQRQLHYPFGLMLQGDRMLQPPHIHPCTSPSVWFILFFTTLPFGLRSAP